MPKAARRESGPQSASRAAPYPASKPAAKETASNADERQPLGSRSPNVPSEPASKPSEKPSSFLDITLDGEDSHSVPIYDTCQIIRSKITGILGKNNHLTSNAIPREFLKDGKPKPYNIKTFCEAIGGVNSNSYRRFMKTKGVMGGAENGTFYGAYCFFEKKRLFEGGKKTAARLSCEKA